MNGGEEAKWSTDGRKIDLAFDCGVAASGARLDRWRAIYPLKSEALCLGRPARDVGLNLQPAIPDQGLLPEKK